MNAYLKAIIAVLGTVVTGLAIYYGNEPWYPIVTSTVAALTVYLAPNTPKVSAPPTATIEAKTVETSDGWDQIK